jgi:hypothetical protein
MPFSVNIEHENVDGDVMLDEFEGVKKVIDPPPTERLRLVFANGQPDTLLRYGTIVQVTDETQQ